MQADTTEGAAKGPGPKFDLPPLPSGGSYRFHAMVEPSGALCNLGCNRLLRTRSGEAGLNYLCDGLKRFYAHIGRDMPEIRRRIGL